MADVRLVDFAFGGGNLVVDTAGVAADEWLVAFVDTDGGGGPPVPTGFTQRASASAAGADTAWAVVKNDVGPGNASYTFSIGGGADGAVHLVAIAPDSGGSIQWDDADATPVASGTSTAMVAPSVDAVEPIAVLLNFWMMWSGMSAGSITLPGGGTALFGNVRSNGWGHRSASFEDVSNGPTGTRTATASATFGHASVSVVFSEVGGDGGTQVDLAGTADVAVDASGSLSMDRSLVGSSDAVADATGTLTVARSLAGAAEAAGDALGALSAVRRIAGTADVAGDALGVLGRNRSAAGQIDAVADASGTLRTTLGLTGSADAAADAIGNFTTAAEVFLAGSVDVAADASAPLRVGRAFAGRVDVAADAGGSLLVSPGYAGVVDVAADAIGALSVLRPLAGTADAAADAVGSFDVDVPPGGRPIQPDADVRSIVDEAGARALMPAGTARPIMPSTG